MATYKSLNLNIEKLAYEDQVIISDTEVKYDFNDVYVICGPTGCGKTSILYCSSSIIPNVGGWKIEGFNGNLSYNNSVLSVIDRNNYKWYLSLINIIFQFPDNNFIANKVYEEFKLLKKLIPNNYNPIHDKLLDDFNIRDLANASINELSEGQKQIIALSCCFLRNPEIIFLDEPLTMLDKENRVQFLSFLCDYKEKNPQKGIIITTHTPFLFASLNPKYLFFNNENKRFAISNDEIKYPITSSFEINLINPYITPNNKSTFVKFENVHIWYDKGNTIKGLSNLNFSFDACQNTLLTGLNGAGKSTLAKTICGLHKEYNGNIIINNKDIKEYNPLKNNTVRTVTQIPGNQIIYSTVKDELTASILSKGNSYVKGIIEEVSIFLNKFNIRLDDDPLLLSFGQQKVVTLLSHLCFPKLLIVDEPTVSLDFEQQTTILDIIKYYHDKGVTTMIISHDPEIFYSVCNSQINLKK